MPERFRILREQDFAHGVTALEQRCGSDPRAAAGPAGHVRRIEQDLTKASGLRIEVGNCRCSGEAQLAVRGSEELDRALDLGGNRGGAIEVPGQKDRPEQRLEFVFCLAENVRQSGFGCSGRPVPDEEAVDLRGHEFGRHRLGQDDIDDLFSVECTALAQELLHPVVVLVLIDSKLEHVVRPPGECPGRFSNIVLGVVADAHREEFQQLPAEIFVGVILDVLPVVQVDEHCWIAHDRQQQIPKIAGCMLP